MFPTVMLLLKNHRRTARSQISFTKSENKVGLLMLFSDAYISWKSHKRLMGQKKVGYMVRS